MTSTVKQTATVVCLMLCVAAFFSDSVVAQRTPPNPNAWNDYPDPYYSYEEDTSIPYKTTLAERTKAADIVVEGRILERNFAKTTEGKYRVYVRVEVHKVFKGKGIKKEMTIIGNEDYLSDNYKKDEMRYRFPDLIRPLDPDVSGDMAIFRDALFFLKKPNTTILTAKNKPVFQFIEDWNGVYTFSSKFAEIVANRRTDTTYIIRTADGQIGSLRVELIKHDLYKEIRQCTRRRYKVITKRPAVGSNAKTENTETDPSDPIGTYTPSSLPSGILDGNQSIVTINVAEGKHFDTTKRPVLFYDADTGGSGDVYVDPQFVTWTDQQVIIKIPSRGFNFDTGGPEGVVPGLNKVPSRAFAFRYQNGVNGIPKFYERNIDIPYAIKDYVSYPDYRETHLYDLNGSGNEGNTSNKTVSSSLK